MKKFLSLIVGVLASIFVYAGSGSASCKVDEVPGAYIYAEVRASGDRYYVKVTSYGVKEGTVNVEFDWKKSGESSHESVLVHFSGGKGEVDAGYFSDNRNESPTISNVKVYNPVCKVSY